jgi:hypothetical protein
MKKAIISSLCSALVIPGLGQIMNQELKKGIIILAAVFVLSLLFIVRLFHMVQAAMASGGASPNDMLMILERLKSEAPSSLFWLLVAFCVLWCYSVVDAFLGGMKQDKLMGG